MSQPSDTPLYYEAARVLTAAEREAVFAIRMTVFVEEQAVPAEEELDAYDVTATHFLARRVDPESFGIIGTARLLDKGDGIGKIGRVAVLREYRGQGVGALLMRRIEHEARAAGYAELILEAQLHALPFYEKLGYLAEGDIFLDCNIEHRLMRKSL